MNAASNVYQTARHRPRLLDLFCCEGGAAVGYHRAGFDVFGVDLFKHLDAKGRRVGFSQKRYPFPSHQGDALDYLLEHGHEFDAVHASPPCQHASAGTRSLRHDGKAYPRLIEPIRDALILLGKPYVIENVRGADLIDPVELCGCMFGLKATDEDGLPLRMERPRGFESNVELYAPLGHDHDPDVWVAGSYGGSRRAKKRPGDTPATLAPRDRHAAKYERKGGYVPRSKAVQQRLLGIDWMTAGGMHQCVPPSYTSWLGWLILDHLALAKAA